jgi:transcription elongation factor GreA
MQEIIAKLSGELKSLERELRVELPREIQKALAMGDLKENAEYHAALERQAFVRARVAQLRTRLGELTKVDLSQISKDRAGLGSSLTLLDLDTDAEVTYELVVPEVADLKLGLVSTSSPIGRGLLGKQVGDEVSIQVPSGTKRFEVLELQTLHDRSKGGS